MEQFFLSLDHFLPFYPPTNLENQILKQGCQLSIFKNPKNHYDPYDLSCCRHDKWNWLVGGCCESPNGVWCKAPQAITLTLI